VAGCTERGTQHAAAQAGRRGPASSWLAVTSNICYGGPQLEAGFTICMVYSVHFSYCQRMCGLLVQLYVLRLVC
jgi:hypothetical protein